MTKEELKDYRGLVAERDDLNRRLEWLRKRPDAEQKVMRTLEECYMDKLEMATEAILSIEQNIESLDPVERELIRLRYIDGKEWQDIADTIGYSWAQTHRHHGKALKKLEAM